MTADDLRAFSRRLHALAGAVEHSADGGAYGPCPHCTGEALLRDTAQRLEALAEELDARAVDELCAELRRTA